MENEGIKKTTTTKNSTKTKRVEPEIIDVVDTKESNEEINALNAENEKLRIENEKQKKEFDEKFAMLQKQIEMLTQATILAKSAPIAPEHDKSPVTIGSRAFADCALSTLDNSLCYVFSCGEEKTLEYEDVKELLKETSAKNNKTLFSNGIFYFANEKDYDRFRVKKLVNLAPENILRILAINDADKMISEINALTNTKNNMYVVHTLEYLIAEMIMDDNVKLRNWSWQNKKTLEDYLGIRFDDLIANTGMYRWLKQNRN